MGRATGIKTDSFSLLSLNKYDSNVNSPASFWLNSKLLMTLHFLGSAEAHYRWINRRELVWLTVLGFGLNLERKGKRLNFTLQDLNILLDV